MKSTLFKALSLIVLFLLLPILHGCVGDTGNAGISGSARQSKVLRVGISTNAPPFAYKVRGKLQGLEVDFARQFATSIGKDVRFVELGWDKQLPTLEQGGTDIIMSGMTITAKRQYRVAFTRPYMRSGQLLLVRSNEVARFSSGLLSLMGNTPAIGTIRNTSGDMFITKTINRPDLTRFDTSSEAVKALSENEIDVLVHDAPIVCHWAATYDKTRLTPILQFATEEYLGWAIAKDNRELLAAANSFITAQEQTGELQKLIKQWIPYL